MTRAVAGVACAATIFFATIAAAQTGRAGAEAGVRLNVAGPLRFDGVPANLTSPDGRPYALFTVSNSLGAETGLEAHASVPLFSMLRLEGAVDVARPTLRTRVAGDVEAADPVTVTDRVMRLAIEAAVVVQFRPGPSHAWFVRAGGGWTRGVTSDRSLLAKGTIATTGAGVKYWIRGGPRGRGGFGLDGEGRMVARWKGLTLDARRLHVTPAAAAGLFFGF